MNRQLARPHRERGAILVSGLVILVLMTLIGIGAMRHAMLEERMAGNFKEAHRAFQAAEAGLRLGESYAASNKPDGHNVGFTALYDAGDAENSNETVPEYAYTLSTPQLREFTSIEGDTAGNAKGGSKKLFASRYTVEASGRTAEASGANSSMRSLFVSM